MHTALSYNGYEAHLLPESPQDKSCEWRTYIVHKGRDCATFHLENGLPEDECRTRFYQVVEHMKTINKKRYKTDCIYGNEDCPQCKPKEQLKMTREEAVKITESVMAYRDDNWTAKKCVECFEALGLLKFEEEKKVKHCISFNTNQFGGKDEVVKIEAWPEGLVLWAGGEIKWKSWWKYYKVGDSVWTKYGLADAVAGTIIREC